MNLKLGLGPGLRFSFMVNRKEILIINSGKDSYEYTSAHNGISVASL